VFKIVGGHSFTTAHAPMKKYHLKQVHGVAALPPRQFGGAVEYAIWGRRNSDSRERLWEHVIKRLQASPWPGAHVPASASVGQKASDRSVLVRCTRCDRQVGRRDLPRRGCTKAGCPLDYAAAKRQWNEWHAEASKMLAAERRQRQTGLRSLSEQGRHMSRLNSQRHAQRRRDEARAAAQAATSR
jgi:hypothetical protein